MFPYLTLMIESSKLFTAWLDYQEKTKKLVTAVFCFLHIPAASRRKEKVGKQVKKCKYAWWIIRNRAKLGHKQEEWFTPGDERREKFCWREEHIEGTCRGTTRWSRDLSHVQLIKHCLNFCCCCFVFFLAFVLLKTYFLYNFWPNKFLYKFGQFNKICS